MRLFFRFGINLNTFILPAFVGLLFLWRNNKHRLTKASTVRGIEEPARKRAFLF